MNTARSIIMIIEFKHIGKSADDLRFFILKDGAHAGGVTVHSVCGTQFSYGVAVTETKRRQGVARTALPMLFVLMRRRGFTTAVVQVAEGNAASLALHQSLGFAETGRESGVVTLTLQL